MPDLPLHGAPDNSPATLVAAVTCANTNNNGSTMDVIDLNGQTFTFTTASFNNHTALPLITTPITLCNGTLTRSGVNNFRFISIDSFTGSVNIESMTMSNGRATTGSAISGANGVILTVRDSTFTGNIATNAATIVASSATLNLINSTVLANSHESGAAVLGVASTINVHNSAISGTTTNSLGEGTALSMTFGGTLNVNNSLISGNSGGSAIYNSGGPVNITNSTIAGNYAASGTGGVVMIANEYDPDGSQLNFRNAIVWDNSSPQDYVLTGGGGVGNSNSIIEEEGFGSPLFVTPLTPSTTASTGGDFRLKLGSSAIDYGFNNNAPLDVFDVDKDSNTSEVANDLYGGNRIVDVPTVNGTNPRVDAGAYEFVQQPGITLSKTSVNVTEGGATDTYTIVLNAQPTADVTVNIGTNSEFAVSPSGLTFTSGNWSTPQTVTVSAVNDRIVEGTYNGSIMHTITSTDLAYNNLAVGNSSVRIIDNDTANVRLAQDFASTSEADGEIIATLTVEFQTNGSGGEALVSGFSVGLSTTGTAQSVTDYTLSASSQVVFSSDGDPQYLTITLVDDAVDEDDEILNLLLGNITTVSAGLANQLSLGSPSSYTLVITDDDTAGVTLNKTSVSLAEGGTTDTYTVRLNSRPTHNVVISINGGTQTLVSPNSLTFMPTNWSAPQTVTVTAANDAVGEGAHSGLITHAAASDDPKYQGVGVINVSASIADDDIGVELTVPTNRKLTEGTFQEVNYEMRLKSQPSQDVIVQIISSTSDVAFSNASSITFTPSDWNQWRFITVVPVNDRTYEGWETDTIVYVVSSSDPLYDGIMVDPLTVEVTDDEAVTLMWSTSANTTAENSGSQGLLFVDLEITGTGTGDWGMSQNLTYAYTVGGTATGGGVDYTLNQSFVSFVPIAINPSSGIGGTPINIDIINDSIDEEDETVIFSLPNNTNPTLYLEGVSIRPPSSTTLTITDDDTAGVAVSKASVSPTEGGANDTYTLVLNSQPTHTVNITLSVPGIETQVVPSSLSFTSANWNTPQTITVSAFNDTEPEGAHSEAITHTVSSTDPKYNGFSVSNVTANVIDNDAGLVVSKSSAAATEGGATDSYTVGLTIPPTANVTVNLTGGSNLGLSPSSLIFTPANWNTPQTVTVSALDDRIVEGDHSGGVGHTTASADSFYNGLMVAGLSVSLTDNDNASVRWAQSTGTTSEANTTATATVEVVYQTSGVGQTSSLSDDFTVSIAVGGTGLSGTDFNVSPTTVTLPASGAAQTVSITSIDDMMDSDDVTATLTLNSIGGSNSAQNARLSIGTPNLYTLTLTDNDTAGVTISPTTLSATEGGATGSYAVSLTSQPRDVVILSVTGTAQASVSPNSLTFTEANWNTPQTVTVTAVDDSTSEGNHSTTLSHSAVSDDPLYNAPTIAGVTVNIIDNDAGATLSKTSVSVAEGGATDTYTVVLRIPPTANVTVNMVSLSQVTASPSSLTFTTANWNVPQTVTVTAIDDAVAELGHTGSVSHSMTSTDPNYANVPVNGVAASIADNDTAGVTLSKTTAAATEGGATDSYTVRLTSQPTAAVTVTLNGTQVSTSPISLEFTSANWNVPQTVTVAAINDFVAEGAHSGTVGHTTFSTDSLYSGLTVASVTVSITDNDTPGLTLSKSSVAVTEGGATDSYTVRLNTQPTSEVSVLLLNQNGQVTLSPTSLTFTTANWDVPQTVTVTASDDTLLETTHTSLIENQISSSDEVYDNLANATLTVNIADNDALPSNLLLNNGFETPLGNDWVGTSLLATDRRMCNGGAFAGACMFRFSSSAASTTTRTLRQTVVSSGWGVAGDTLNFAAQAQAIGFTGAMRMVIEVTYTDDTTARQRVVLPTGSYAYAQQVVSITLTKPVASVTVVMEARNDIGVMRFDNTRLRLLLGSQNAPLALPDLAVGSEAAPLPLPDPQ